MSGIIVAGVDIFLFFFFFLVKVIVKFIRRGTEERKGEKYSLFPTQETGAKTPVVNSELRKESWDLGPQWPI
jgi:flagellar biosynthesis/type III secretory pathway M-ring protein FliF/YscJ